MNCFRPYYASDVVSFDLMGKTATPIIDSSNSTEYIDIMKEIPCGTSRKQIPSRNRDVSFFKNLIQLGPCAYLCLILCYIGLKNEESSEEYNHIQLLQKKNLLPFCLPQTKSPITTTGCISLSENDLPTPKSTQESTITASDPTRKTMDLLIQQVMEQKDQYVREQAGQEEGRKRKNLHESKAKSKLLLKTKTYRSQKCAKEGKPLSNQKSIKKRKFDIHEINNSKTTTEPQKKRAKIKHTIESNDFPSDLPDGFGNLLLEKLESYILPQQALQTEKRGDPSYPNEIKRIIKDAVTNQPRYIQVYTALLNLEEAAETLQLQRYNQKHLKFKYSNSGRIFQMKKDVSNNVMF